MGLNDWIGKDVCIELKKANSKFFGKILEVQDCGSGLIFVTLLDKFGKHQIFASGEIARVEELR